MMWMFWMKKENHSTNYSQLPQLKAGNLFVNGTNTEYTHVSLPMLLEVNENGDPIRKKEKWRKSKILGSLLCSTFDITTRCYRHA